MPLRGWRSAPADLFGPYISLVDAFCELCLSCLPLFDSFELSYVTRHVASMRLAKMFVSLACVLILTLSWVSFKIVANLVGESV